MNDTGLTPLGHAVLTELYDPEMQGTSLIIPVAVQERAMMIESKVRVIEAGPCAWEDEREPRARPGDIVLVTKYAGYLTKSPLNNKWYRLINDRDMFCRVQEVEK